MEEIGRGAEAVLLKDGNKLLKQRIRKGYRHEELDFMLRRRPTRVEVKLLGKAAEFINVPKVHESSDKDMSIVMDFIDGNRVKDVFNSVDRVEVCKQIGRDVAKLHANNLIHGDLTTSNLLLKGEDLFFIDFGLGFISDKTEDKAVDLRLLRQALESKHYDFPEAFEYVLTGYSEWNGSKEVLNRLEKVEGRGRYKQQV